MSDRSSIEWTDATWNPVTGCEKVSPGCDRCYAETFAERWRGTPGHYFERGFDVQLRPDKLDQPLRWRKPRKVFVNSMSDLFHDAVPDEYIARVFAVMAQTPQHTYQILTKRHGRMRSLLRKWSPVTGSVPWVHTGPWPLPNVWLGVSVEDQKWADIRIPALLETPSAVRFLSCEPLLGPVDLSSYLTGDCPSCGDDITEDACGPTHAAMQLDPTARGINWVIAGGESGPGARPMHPDWVRSLRDQCEESGAAFLFKQWGAWRPEPIYDTVSGRFHLVMPDGRDRGTPWAGWGIDQPDAVVMERVGKGAAGRELDGRTWDEFPAVSRG